MDEPLVTVVLPSYNHAAWLGETIGSVLAQTMPRWELLVIDDGSRDDSVAVARSFVDPRIQVLPQANAGADAAINRGLGLATAPYTAIINSDDRWRPRRLERLLNAAERLPAGQPDTLWFTDLAVIDAWGRLDLGRMWGPHYDLRSRCAAWSLPRVLRRGNLAHTTSNFFAPTRLFRELNGMRPLRYVHDWDFLLRALGQRAVARLPETLMDYRVHGRNTISENAGWKHLAEAAFIAGVHLMTFQLDELDPLEDSLELFVANPCFPSALAWTFHHVHMKAGEEAALALAVTDAGIERMKTILQKEGFTHTRALLPPLGVMHYLPALKSTDCP